ncbi:MAG: hypothetical protein QM539_10885 [Alphaproteobacteria bacterium]|nr:hypothetical protein [Alphaproteobacteria bacterium]
MKNKSLKDYNLEELSHKEIINIEGGKSIFYYIGYAAGASLRVVEGVAKELLAHQLTPR